MAKLIYIADPMCSWCYGFGPELNTLLSGLPDTQLELIVGGLRAYNKEVMDEKLKATLLEHWKKVEQVSGLPFAKDGLSHEGFIYDTEPACRAVVAAGMLAPDTALDVFHAIQHGFYAENLDTTKGELLADIAAAVFEKADIQIDAAEFLRTWASEEARNATEADFTQTKLWGVSGFPTLVLEKSGELYLVTSGYTKTETLVERLQELIDQPA